MAKRPITVALTGWLFVVTGCAVVVAACVRFLDPSTRGAAPADAHHLGDFAWAAASGLLAGAGGAFVLRGRDWARWTLVVWMAGHVVLSAMHSAEQLAVHVALFLPLTWFLFRRPASEFFRAGRAA